MNAEKHPKQEFQVERVAFFSDAVFAIAITLLVIDFKVPAITKESTYSGVLHNIAELKYNFFALLLSFVLISVYWFRHHFLFKHIHNYNRRVLIANMIVLLPILFFPFTTSLFAKSLANDSVRILATRIYYLNHISAMVAFLIFYLVVLVRHREFTYDFPVKERVEFISGILFIIAVFSMFIVCTFLPEMYNNIFLGVALPAILLKKRVDKYLAKRLENRVGNKL